MNDSNKKFNSHTLAINGAKPFRQKEWIDNFTTGPEEIEAITKVLNSGYLSLFEGSHTPDKPFSFHGGPAVQSLENFWSEYYNVKHSVSMNSATSGLYAAIGALNLGFGDEVIVSPYTMSACAVAPLIYGAIPVFADVDNSGSLDPNSIRKKISPRTKAILVVHQFGVPARMDEIIKIKEEFNLVLIEDCAQAHGASFHGKNVGTFGEIGVFSLNVNKTIQSGEGGVCITDDDEIAYRLKLIRNHGEAVVEAANYEKIENVFGFNYRMTEVQAAIAYEQLKKLSNLNELRLEMVGLLKEYINSKDYFKFIDCCDSCDDDHKKNSHPTFYLAPFLVTTDHFHRNEFIDAVNAEGLLFAKGYVRPLYLQPIYQQKRFFKHGYPFSAKENHETSQNYSIGECPNAEDLHFNRLVTSEHIRPPNSLDDVKDIIDIFEKVLNS